jgi:hypothetical protein
MSVEHGRIRATVTECLTGGRSLTFDEVYECVTSKLGDARKIEVREVLSELIREGVVKREPDYERRRMVFRLSEGGG